VERDGNRTKKVWGGCGPPKDYEMGREAGTLTSLILEAYVDEAKQTFIAFIGIAMSENTRCGRLGPGGGKQDGKGMRTSFGRIEKYLK